MSLEARMARYLVNKQNKYINSAAVAKIHQNTNLNSSSVPGPRQVRRVLWLVEQTHHRLQRRRQPRQALQLLQGRKGLWPHPQPDGRRAPVPSLGQPVLLLLSRPMCIHRLFMAVDHVLLPRALRLTPSQTSAVEPTNDLKHVTQSRSE